MAAIDSPLTSYSDTTAHKRQITDAISLIDPTDAAVVEALGGLDGAAGKFRFVNEKHTKVEWLEDTHAPLTGAVAVSTFASSATAITVVDGSLYQPGFVLLIGAEYIWVSAVSTNTLTVTRNFGGTQATINSSAAISIVSEARLEGADSDALAFTDKTAPFNYTQIFHQEVKISGTMQEIPQYGAPSEMQYQINKAVPHLMRLMNLSAYHGQRAAGSATTPRAFGGFGTFITDNTVNASVNVTQANFEDALEAAYNDGGSGPWTAFVSPANMQVIKGWYDNSGWVRIDRTETTAGMVINNVLTPFGVVELVMDRHAPNATIYIVDKMKAGYKTFRPFFWEPLAKDGDSDTVEVVGEFTLCVKNDKAHAALTTIGS